MDDADRSGMNAGQPGACRGARRLVSASLVTATGLGFLAFTLAAGADVGTVSGSAFGASGTVTVDDYDASTPPNPSTLDPAPTVTLPPSGGDVTATAPSTSFGPGGAYLTTGLLTVSSQGTTGPGGSTTTTASVDNVDAMGYLTASNVTSTCTASEVDLQASTAMSPDARLVLDEDTTIALIANPSPNERHHGSTSSGDTYTVIVNEQTHTTNSITVTAVHLILEGPTVTGHIYLGQSHCDVTVVAGTTSTGPWPTDPSTSTSAPTDPTTTSPTDPTTTSPTDPTTTSPTDPPPPPPEPTTTTVVPASTCSNGQGPVRRPLPPAAEPPATPRCPDATG